VGLLDADRAQRRPHGVGEARQHPVAALAKDHALLVVDQGAHQRQVPLHAQMGCVGRISLPAGGHQRGDQEEVGLHWGHRLRFPPRRLRVEEANALSSRPESSPASTASMPAAATMAALSVQRLRGGRMHERPCRAARSVQAARSLELAATPPAITIWRTGTCPRAFSIFSIRAKPHRQGIALQIAACGELVNDASPGIPQPQDLRRLVVGLAHGVVARGAQEGPLPRRGDVEEQGVPAGDEQRQLRILRFRRRPVGPAHEGRLQVGLEVVHAHQGFSGDPGQGLGGHQADQQGAHQAGTGGDGDGVDGVEAPAAGEGLVEHRDHGDQVLA